MPLHVKRVAAVLAAAVAIAMLGSVAVTTAGAAPPSATALRRATLVNYPGARVCQYHRFTVGVWAQPGTSWADRRFVINVYNPNSVRVLHKSGHAPTDRWRKWHPKASQLGKYHTVYKVWNNGTVNRSSYFTRSHRC